MWYVVQTVAGREFAVCRLIESLVEDDVLQECFVPRYEVQKQFRGQWRTCTATLFPGYLIVVTDRVDELESQLRRVPAFAWVLSNDGGFVPLERDEVAWIDAFTEKGHRTVGVSEGVIEGDRIIVLKGPETIISDGARTEVYTAGTAALAKAGTGDVLAGAIGGLLAQGVAPFKAACLGVTLHGEAGKIAAEQFSEVSVCAEEVVESLPQAIQKFLGELDQREACDTTNEEER